MCLEEHDKPEIRKKKKKTLISGEDDENGFQCFGSEVSAGYLGIDVQWDAREIVWNSGDRFGQNSKPSGLLVLFLTPDICLFPTSRSKLERRQQMH